jgi:serine/threonine protein kinase
MSRTQFGPWEKLSSLGKGGQGEVFLARKASTNMSRLVESVLNSVKVIADTQPRYTHEEAEQKAAALISVMRAIAVERDAPLAALKILHPIEDKDALAKAVGRMKKELAALAGFDHPALVRVFESDPEETWFVMQYFRRGALADDLNRTRGDLLATLRAFRPLVEAVSELHKQGFVHRDIKPANVFIADDGRLVLGDFGLVIEPVSGDARLTDTYENVGSRDWMPGWAMGRRMDEVGPSFDVFSLGKLLWSMLSGKRFLRLWYFDKPEFNVEMMFPENRAMRWATRIFKKCIVEDEVDCRLLDAGKLLTEVDQTIEAVGHGGQVPRKKEDSSLRCGVCGIGFYRVRIPYAGEDMVLYCENCGCEYRFRGVKDKPGWE